MNKSNPTIKEFVFWFFFNGKKQLWGLIRRKKHKFSDLLRQKLSDLSESSYHLPNSAKWLQKTIPLVVHWFTKLTRNKYRNHSLIKLFPGENDRSDINSSWVPLWSFKSDLAKAELTLFPSLTWMAIPDWHFPFLLMSLSSSQSSPSPAKVTAMSLISWS